jgi:phosphoglycerate dehydrogenase-like enzyme
MTSAAVWPALPGELRDMGLRHVPEGIEVTWLPRPISDADLIKALGPVQSLVLALSREFSPDVYPHLGRLRLLQLMSAGYDRLDLAAVRRYRITAASNGGANAVGVAEHTLMLMLALMKNVMALDAATRAGRFRPVPVEDLRIPEMAGKTAGLIGLGMIGREVAKRLRAFDDRVLYYDIRRAAQSVERDLGVTYFPMADVLAQADLVSVHVPLTDATRGLMSRDAFRRMKPGAYFINTSRGGVVDEAALVETLDQGRLAGAGLDVFGVEPAPAGHPLLAPRPNVIVTPHTAGLSWESWDRRFANAFANVGRVARGEPPLWIIPELLEPAAERQPAAGG